MDQVKATVAASMAANKWLKKSKANAAKSKPKTKGGGSTGLQAKAGSTLMAFGPSEVFGELRAFHNVSIQTICLQLSTLDLPSVTIRIPARWTHPGHLDLQVNAAKVKAEGLKTVSATVIIMCKSWQHRAHPVYVIG